MIPSIIMLKPSTLRNMKPKQSVSLVCIILIVFPFNDDIADHLSVWELEDYESKKLSLKHKIYFNNVRTLWFGNL